MGLTEYKRKRDFHRTPEPAGKRAAKKGWAFVVQKHDARNLHYDFRLELDGVLKSWAVPKGPSLDPSVKRLAMHVEDHPVEYGDFEGIIPKGEYGGGTVMLWDRGYWEPIGDPHQSYADGKLKFQLFGKKLSGKWMLLRTGGRSSSDQGKVQWLLFKERDDKARPATAGDILVEQPNSVATGRTLEEIAEDGDWVWNPKGKNAKPKLTNRRRFKEQISPRSMKISKRSTKTDTSVRLTSPAKVLYPEQGITKLDLANYYIATSAWILPHIANRPLVLVRCPEGCAKTCFFQKHPVVGTPDSLRQIHIRDKDGTKPYLVADDVAGLAALAQIAGLEFHIWGSRADMLEKPDRMIFDLDPDPTVAWTRTVGSAHMIRQFLQELGLESFVKTTGGKGLHLVLPIDRRHEWYQVKEFCKSVADLCVKAAPAYFTANMAKAARVGKIYIDFHRNSRGATTVAPYSPRARSGAPVSMPLAWSDLNDRLPSDYFTIQNVTNYLASRKRDPWCDINKTRQNLAGPMKKLRTVMRPVKSPCSR